MNPYETVAAELRKLGLIIHRLPGEYVVNFHDGVEKTARFAEDLNEALELGRAMAAEAAAGRTMTEKSPRRRWRRKRMTPKVRRRRFILRHNRRVRRRAMRKTPSKR